MPHDTPLISTIVAGLVLAFLLGAMAHRLKMPPLVGYLLAGVLVGPYTPGFIANGELANELSEIGVILLMFGVGLHFSLKDLLSVQGVAVPGALVRIAGGTAMGMGMGYLLGWPIGGGLVFGLSLSVASTVVLLKALQDRHLVESERGRIAIGWVIVEDIAMVLALVLIPALAGLMGGTSAELHDPFIDLVERLANIELNIWAVLAVTLVKLVAFVGFMLVVGRRVIPWILHLTAHTGSRELFRLAVLAIALGVAAGSAYLFGVSLALGAFFAGMILSESELSNRAAQETLPLRDAFSVLFFVAVGMLFDPTILWTHTLEVLGTLLIILVGKSVIAFGLVVALKRPVSAALTIAASLAQVGEFSFILAALGVSLGLLPQEGQSYVLAGALISIILNPILMYVAEHVRPRLEARIAATTPAIIVPQRVEPSLTAMAAAAPLAPTETGDEQLPTRLTDHAVLIGYGRVGTVVAEGLATRGTPFVLIEDSEKRVAAAHAAGIEVVVGNAASGKALALANVAGARTLYVAIPNAFEAGQAVEQARAVGRHLTIVARAHSDEEIGYLTGLGADEVIMGEREIGMGMLGWIGVPAVPAAPEPAKPAPRPEPSMRSLPLTTALEPSILDASADAATPRPAPASAPTAMAAAAPEPAPVPPKPVPAAAVMAEPEILPPGSDFSSQDDKSSPSETLETAVGDVPVSVAIDGLPEAKLVPGTDAPPKPLPPRRRAGGPATTASIPFAPYNEPETEENT